MATRKTIADRGDRAQLINRGADSKYVGDEPQWDKDKTYGRIDIMRALNWYNYLYNADDAKNFMVQMLNSMPKRKELAKKLKTQKKLPIATTYGWLSRAVFVGYPATFTEQKRLAKAIREVETFLNAQKEEVVVVKATGPEVYKPTIQDYLREKTSETIGELEGRVDDFMASSDNKANAFALLKERNTPQAQTGKIIEWANHRVAEFKEVQEGKDKELVEAYSNFTKTKVKAIIKFFESVVADCESYVTTKKAVKKPRIAKAKSADKIVAKVKYLKSDTTLKVTSINPQMILGASEVWVFNIKTRKLGRYVADSTTGPLGIKGTSITCFDEANSIAKTLRKPAEKLKELLDAGKIQIKKFMAGISAVDIKLTGRLNEDTLIVKVIK